MNDKWLNDIHDRMSDFEIDEPVNLWNDIRSRQINKKKSVAGIIKPWAKRATSVAALIAIVFTATYLINVDHDVVVPEEKTSAIIQPAVKQLNTINQHNHTANLTSERQEIPHNGHSKSNISYATKTNTGSQTQQSTIETIEDKPTVADRQTDNNDKEPMPSMSDNKRQYKYERPTKRHLPNKSNSERIYISLYTSGGYDYSNSMRAMSGIEYSSTGTNGAIWEDKPMLGILMLNQGKQIKSDIHHRLPIRTGLSVAYRINDRISVESGLTYTNLTSDLKEGSESHYMSGEQVLHYIGIPLNVKYRIASWKRLGLYASCGMLAEKCVSGKTDTKYIIDNRKQESETHNTIVRPVQWSANASVGVQFDISHAIGVYAEPGVSYYIDNGSSVKTIYQDKPLNFNVNVGLRLNLGN